MNSPSHSQSPSPSSSLSPSPSHSQVLPSAEEEKLQPAITISSAELKLIDAKYDDATDATVHSMSPRERKKRVAGRVITPLQKNLHVDAFEAHRSPVSVPNLQIALSRDCVVRPETLMNEKDIDYHIDQILRSADNELGVCNIMSEVTPRSMDQNLMWIFNDRFREEFYERPDPERVYDYQMLKKRPYDVEWNHFVGEEQRRTAASTKKRDEYARKKRMRAWSKRQREEGLNKLRVTEEMRKRSQVEQKLMHAAEMQRDEELREMREKRLMKKNDPMGTMLKEFASSRFDIAQFERKLAKTKDNSTGDGAVTDKSSDDIETMLARKRFYDWMQEQARDDDYWSGGQEGSGGSDDDFDDAWSKLDADSSEKRLNLDIMDTSLQNEGLFFDPFDGGG